MAKHEPKPAPDFEPDYGIADPDYDEAPQASFEDVADPDYDEARQVDYDTDFADPDAQEAGQEYQKRSQK